MPESTKELSPTMLDALTFARKHGGKLRRWPGGFWCRGDSEHWERPAFATPTVEALVKRGVFAYTKWFEGSRARFPIEASVLERPLAAIGGDKAE